MQTAFIVEECRERRIITLEEGRCADSTAFFGRKYMGVKSWTRVSGFCGWNLVANEKKKELTVNECHKQGGQPPQT